MPNRPILFMRTGTFAAAPRGFSSQLAEAYDATLINMELVKANPDVQEEVEILRQNARATSTHDAKSRHAIRVKEWYKEEMDVLTVDALSEGRNVVYDELLNKPGDRGRVYQVARSCGAQTVLLAILADRRVAMDRIRERYPDPGSKQSRAVKQLDYTERQLRQGGWPGSGGRPEDYLLIDGNDSVENMLARVALYLPSQGIDFPGRSRAA